MWLKAEGKVFSAGHDLK
jgi:enoyl-CoA hydratase/carnithine racemase